MFCYKVHGLPGKKDRILAICDRELIGKVIRKEPLFEVGKEFYGKEICDEEEILEKMKSCTIVNVVGKKIITLCVEKKLITKENVILIGEIPHAQFIK
ncbi:MAG: DUF424 family protein [Candidatus Aenigmarchaeota archaeon]|nr:DUF424 family protein [Candidatus Aenigmarchaeota archaeon]